MSVRYGVALIPEPTFTARVYRARQLVCGQYGSWAAEMHLLHLSLVGYFECTDQTLQSLCAGLSRIAEGCRRRALRFPLLSRGVTTLPEAAEDIFLDFTVSDNPLEKHQRKLNDLHCEVVDMLEQTEGAVPDLRSARDNFHPRIYLMQHANLPPEVFHGAVEFARMVMRDLEVPNATRAWNMLLLRFESDAAGDNWDLGSWAADLRWRILAGYPL